MTVTAPAEIDEIDEIALDRQRRRRLHETMANEGVAALLTSDPISIRYATGTRNMLVHGMTGPDRLALVLAGGPTVLWEFAGCEHLSTGRPGVDEILPAPALTAKKSLNAAADVATFAGEVAERVCAHLGRDDAVGVEKLEFDVVDALRGRGLRIVDGTRSVQLAMAIKQPAEITAMRSAVAVTEHATRAVEAAIAPGATEQEVWAEFHRSLIAGGGELVVARLLQAGVRTFPYFQEASHHRMQAGDLVCFDTDAVARHGYSVDFSRTFLCGDEPASGRQRALYGLAKEQLDHNAANLEPGLPFEEFARRAFDVPEPHRRYGYYQLAHGLGLAGGHPNVPRHEPGRPYPLPGVIEPGMVLCVESYVGDPGSGQGVKLEDQFLIGEVMVETMSTYRFEPRLIA